MFFRYIVRDSMPADEGKGISAQRRKERKDVFTKGESGYHSRLLTLRCGRTLDGSALAGRSASMRRMGHMTTFSDSVPDGFTPSDYRILVVDDDNRS